MRNQYKVPTTNLPGALEKLAKLNARAEKLNCAPVTFSVVGTEEYKDGEGHTTVYQLLEVTGEAPKLNGWAFVATLQHTENGNIIRTIPGGEAPAQYREVRPVCDHCKMDWIQRKDTFIVRHDDGTLKQVGRDCLKDFTGHTSPEAIARWAQYLTHLDDLFAEDGLGGTGVVYDYYDLPSYLAFVVHAIEEHGWLSRGKAWEEDRLDHATADVAFREMENRVRRWKPGDEEHTKVQVALQWVRDEMESGTDDYLNNLKIACAIDNIEARTIGIAASLIPAYDREMSQRKWKAEQVEEGAKSNHIGEVKEKVTRKMYVKFIKGLNGDYGITYLHKMVDEDGNIFTWYCSGEPMEEGQWFEVTGTVKQHTEWNGVKETILTRCKGVLL